MPRRKFLYSPARGRPRESTPSWSGLYSILRSIPAVTHHKGRISHHHRIGRNILPNHTARAQNRPLTNVYARKNDDIIADPNIVLNTNWPNLRKPLKNHRGIYVCCPMVSAEKFDIRPNHNIVSDGNGSINHVVIAKAGAVSQGERRGKMSAAMYINLLAAVRQNNLSTQGTDLSARKNRPLPNRPKKTFPMNSLIRISFFPPSASQTVEYTAPRFCPRLAPARPGGPVPRSCPPPAGAPRTR